MTTKEVAQRFDTTWATTSRHLEALERAGQPTLDGSRQASDDPCGPGQRR
jgi:hypothetical protein